MTASLKNEIHSACYGEETHRLVVGLLLWWSRCTQRTRRVSWRQLQTGRQPVSQRHISHDSVGRKKRIASESSGWRLLGCDQKLDHFCTVFIRLLSVHGYNRHASVVFGRGTWVLSWFHGFVQNGPTYFKLDTSKLVSRYVDRGKY